MSMSTRSRRISRRTAERLLHGSAPTDVRGEPLAGLLRAAAGPVRSGELSGERAALAAFRTAPLAPAPGRRRRVPFRAPSVLTVQVAAVAAGTLAVVGVAVALVTGQPAPRVPGLNPAAATSTIPHTSTLTPSAVHPAGGAPEADPRTASPPLVNPCQPHCATAPGRPATPPGQQGSDNQNENQQSETSQQSLETIRTNPNGDVVPNPNGKSHSGGPGPHSSH